MKTINKAVCLAAATLAVTLSGCASSPKMDKFSRADERFVLAGTSVDVQLKQGVTVRNRDESDPAPVLFTMTNAGKFLRSDAYANASCNVLGSAVGDAVTKRMNIEVKRISCVDGDGVPIVSSPAKGYVYGEDHGLGLAAHIVDSDGRQVLSVDGDRPATVVIAEDFGFHFGK